MIVLGTALLMGTILYRHISLVLGNIFKPRHLTKSCFISNVPIIHNYFVLDDHLSQTLALLSLLVVHERVFCIMVLY